MLALQECLPQGFEILNVPAETSFDEIRAEAFDLSLDEGREANYPASINLDNFQSKIERQLGGSIYEQKIQGRLMLLMYRKMCQMSTTIKSLNQRLQEYSHNPRHFQPLTRLQSESDYYDFLERLKDVNYKNNVVSAYHMYRPVFITYVRFLCFS